MASLFDRYKNYRQYKSLLKQGKEVLEDKSSFKKFKEDVKTAYKNGSQLNDYQDKLSNLQSLQNTEDTNYLEQHIEDAQYNFSSGRSIIEQFKYYKSYKDLIKNGERVFETSAEYNNWVDQVNSAYNENLPLDDFDYSLKMFEALKISENSAIYINEVNNLTKDATQFKIGRAHV